MSGRPIDPTVWSNGTSYPLGVSPWSGTLTSNPPVYSFFTPGVPPAAQEMNQLFQSATQAELDILHLTGQMAGQTFRKVDYTPGIAADMTCRPRASNSSLRAEWLLGRLYAGPIQDVARTWDGGESWNEPAAAAIDSLATAWVSCISADPSTTLAGIANFEFSSDQTKVYKYDAAANSLTFEQTITHAYFTDSHYFNGLHILIGPASPAGVTGPQTYSSPDCVTWTARAPSGPTRYTTTAAFCSAASPSMIVVLPRSQPTGTGPFKMVSTVNGTTWTISDFLPGDGAQAVVWDAAHSIFVCSVATTLSSNLPVSGSKIYTSVDGLTWTLGTTLTSQCITGMAAIGALILANTVNGDLIMSYDGGVTWRLSGYHMTPGGTPAINTKYVRPGVSSSGNRFLAYGSAVTAMGLAVGEPATIT